MPDTNKGIRIMKKSFMLVVMSCAMMLSVNASTFCSQSVSSPVSMEMNDGYFSRTGHSVQVICDSGANKGYYDIYLHQGRKYIKFRNCWICIQGRYSFAYAGNRYYLK